MSEIDRLTEEALKQRIKTLREALADGQATWGAYPTQELLDDNVAQ